MWNWSSKHQFPARIIYHAITDTRRGSKKRRSQTSPPLPPLFTHFSYPSTPLPSFFHYSVLSPVPIWYHIQTLILLKCSTEFSFRRWTMRWDILLVLSLRVVVVSPSEAHKKIGKKISSYMFLTNHKKNSVWISQPWMVRNCKAVI